MPITQGRLPARQRRDGCGFRTQDARSQTYRRKKGQFPESVKFRWRESAFRPNQKRPITTGGVRRARRLQDLIQWRCLAGFRANQEAPPVRPVRQGFGQFLRRGHVRQGQTFALFGRFRHVGAQPVRIDPGHVGVLREDRPQRRVTIESAAEPLV